MIQDKNKLLLVTGIALISILFIFLAVQYGWNKMTTKKPESSISVPIVVTTSDQKPPESADENKTSWQVYGKYEVASNEDHLVIRSSGDHQEVYRVPINIAQLTKKEGEEIREYIVGDKLDKIFLFVSVIDSDGSKTQPYNWRIFQLSLDKEHIGQLAIFSDEGLGSDRSFENLMISPDQKYLSFIDVDVWGEVVEPCPPGKNLIKIYNLLDKDTKYEIGSVSNLTQERGGIVEEYSSTNNPQPLRWVNDTTIEFRYDRYECVSPSAALPNYPDFKETNFLIFETWQYDIANDKYTLIKSEPLQQ